MAVKGRVYASRIIEKAARNPSLAMDIGLSCHLNATSPLSVGFTKSCHCAFSKVADKDASGKV